jgi:hypothetical protein
LSRQIWLVPSIITYKKERYARPSEITSQHLSHTYSLPILVAVRAKPQTILPFKWGNTVGDSTSNMVKTGIPFMLYESIGLQSGTGFVDLYDRMNYRVCCTRHDSNGAALYEVYSMLAGYINIPLAVLEYGAAGALGNISLMGPEGSYQTQTMAAFLVEVGGCVNATSSFLPHFLHSFAHKRSWHVLRSIDHATGNSSLLMGMNIAGVGEPAQKRISNGL